MSEALTVVYTVLAVQNHTPSINELDSSEYYNTSIPDLDYLIVEVETPVTHAYLDWEMIPSVHHIANAMYDYNQRMQAEHRASAYLYTCGVLVSVIKVARGAGDWSSEDERSRPNPPELWVMPSGEKYLNMLRGMGTHELRHRVVWEEEPEEAVEEITE